MRIKIHPANDSQKTEESDSFGWGQQGHQSAEAETDSESDCETLEPESEVKLRLPRGAKTAALEK